MVAAVRDDAPRRPDDLPELLGRLGEAAERLGAIRLSKPLEIRLGDLEALRGGLVEAKELLAGLFVRRARPIPAPKATTGPETLGSAARRALPQRLAAQLTDELNEVTQARLSDLPDEVAARLLALVGDLLRVVDNVGEARATALRRAAPRTVVSLRRPKPRRPAAGPAAPARPSAPAAPSAPAEAGPDLAPFEARDDEAGSVVEDGGASAWFASAAGPRAAGVGLAAAFAVSFPGGLALAVADGARSSLGARLAAVVAVRTFCRLAAAKGSDPVAALRTTQRHLDVLLSALLASGDASDALTRVRGTVPAGNARRILAHTRRPEESLRRVPPALACGIVGAVARATETGLRVSAVRLGSGTADFRAGGRVAPLLGPSRPGEPPFLAPGARGAAELSRIEAAPPVTLGRGDALLLSTPAVALGAPGAWSGLAALWTPFPDGLAGGESARQLLERAERWGEAEPSSFGGPLAFALLLAR